MQVSFSAAKAALTAATSLAHPSELADISLAVDARDHHIGGMLQQKEAGSWRPLLSLAGS